MAMNRECKENLAEDQDKTRLTGGPTGISGLQRPFVFDGKLQPGDIVGDNYEVIALLGTGGMGCVYSVRHRILQKIYAMKTINSEFVSDVAWRRLQVEAQAMARINHPNIVAVHNLGIHQDKLPYFIMDLLQGQNLADILKAKGSLPLAETIEIFLEVCAGLGFAHRKGIVHRDIKPGNIIILDKAEVSGARVKLVDFGIAKLAGTSDPDNQKLTSVGEVFGSPLYMSPEQCDGKRIDARSDIYSLGCTIFETLTGRAPFRGSNPVITMLMHKEEKPPDLSICGKNFPQSIKNVVATLLAKEPMDRYQNLERLASDLQDVLTGDFVAVSPFAAHVNTELDDQDEQNEQEYQEELAGAQSKIKTVFKSPASVVALLAAFFLMLAAVGFCVFAVTGKPGKVNQAIEPVATTAPQTALISSTKLTMPAFATIADDGKRVQFTFPENLELGKISDREAVSSKQDATGTIVFKAGSRIYFYPSDYTIAHPQLMNSFNRDDLYSISTPANLDKCNLSQFLPCITHLKGLQRLNLQQTKTSDEDIKYLNQLPALTNLNVNYTNISGKGLSKLERLKKLTTISFSGNKGVHDLLVALKGTDQLTSLTMEACDTPLANLDAQIIGGFKNLVLLDLVATDSSDQTLSYLTELPHLEFIDVSGCNVTESGIKKLKQSYSKRKLAVHCAANRTTTMATFGNESPENWFK